jgi:hypothetical protein
MAFKIDTTAIRTKEQNGTVLVLVLYCTLPMHGIPGLLQYSLTSVSRQIGIFRIIEPHPSSLFLRLITNKLRTFTRRNLALITLCPMKIISMFAFAFVASSHAFAPKTNVAFSVAKRAFSRSTAAMMANPQGKCPSRASGLQNTFFLLPSCTDLHSLFCSLL